MRPGEILYDVQDGYVRLVAAETNQRFGVITDDESLVLLLNARDALRASQEIGGEHGGPDDHGLDEWEISGAALTDHGLVDRVLILILRALARAAPADGPASPAALTSDDVTTAAIEACRFAPGPEDMQLYWSQRLSALHALFGCAETQYNSITHSIMAAAADSFATDSSPLAGMLECPIDVARVAEPHVDPLRRIEASRQRAGRALIADLLRHINPRIDQLRLTEADLAALGISPHPPRDLLALIQDGDYP